MAISLETQPFVCKVLVMCHVKFTAIHRFYTNIILYTHADNLTFITYAMPYVVSKTFLKLEIAICQTYIT